MTQPEQTNGHAPRTLATVNDDAGLTLNAMASADNFIAAKKMALDLSRSTLLPAHFRGDDGVANVVIALEMANRIGTSFFAVAQSLYIVHGKPGWASTFLIATVNASKRFTPLRFEWSGQPGTDARSCTCIAKDVASGEPCQGISISLGAAKAMGWAKNSDMWRHLPDQMLVYRAAAFWTRAYCPEVTLGMQTAEELADVIDVPASLPSAPSDTTTLEAQIRASAANASGSVAGQPQAGERAPGKGGTGQAAEAVAGNASVAAGETAPTLAPMLSPKVQYYREEIAKAKGAAALSKVVRTVGQDYEAGNLTAGERDELFGLVDAREKAVMA